MPLLCLIVNSKATPSYKSCLALPLCQVDQLTYIATYPEDHPKVKCGSSHFHDHAIVPILGHHVETQFPGTHLSSYSIDSLLLPKQPMTKILGFF